MFVARLWRPARGVQVLFEAQSTDAGDEALAVYLYFIFELE